MAKMEELPEKVFELKMPKGLAQEMAGLGDTIHVFMRRKESKTQQQRKSIEDLVKESEAKGNPSAVIIAKGDGTYDVLKP